MKFSKKTLDFIKSHMNDPHEICTNVKEDNSELILENVSKGNTDGRRFCNFKSCSNYMFHTHPITCKPYPSMEDILLVVNHECISKYIIASKWGMWVIEKLTAIKMEDDYRKSVEIMVTKENNKLYRISVVNHQALDMNDDIYKYLMKYTRKLNALLPYINIRFHLNFNIDI